MEHTTEAEAWQSLVRYGVAEIVVDDMDGYEYIKCTPMGATVIMGLCDPDLLRENNLTPKGAAIARALQTVKLIEWNPFQ